MLSLWEAERCGKIYCGRKKWKYLMRILKRTREAGSDWRREIAAAFALPVKIEPTAVIALGWPGETKEIRSRGEPEKIHYGQW